MAGFNVYRNINLVATGVAVKAAGGRVYGYHIINAAVAARFVKLYNQVAAPAPATDTPKMTIRVAASSDTYAFFGAEGIDFPLGIGIIGTNLIADTDTTAPSANDIVVNLIYR